MNRSRAMLGVVGSQPRSEVMSVTPEMAKKWLAANTEGNRPVSDGTVNVYARDMVAGRWHLTHQGIAFNKTGELIDGQHRLLAVVKSGIPVDMLVSTGFDVEFDSPLDQGRLRSAANIMHKDTRWVAAVRCLYWMSRAELSNANRRISIGEIQQSYASHQAAVDQVWAAFYNRMPGGVLAAMMWTLPFAEEATMNFGIQVRDGEMLERGDPAYALRNWLAKNTKAKPVEFVYATLGALKHTIEGSPLINIFATPNSYRWTCQKRRAAKLGATPDATSVPATV